MRITRDVTFDSFASDEKSYVFEVFPDVFEDGRGSFSEVLKDHGEWNENCQYPLWFSNPNWIRQINRSKSSESVVRGCHAQRGIYCQGKLVEAVNEVIFDIITDARPDSCTFGVSKAYRLDPKKQNKLWVPRGFLHSFVTPDTLSSGEAVFNYYVDNSYNKGSEICVNPLTVIPDLVESLSELCSRNKDLKLEFQDLLKVFAVKDMVNISEKDKRGLDYSKFCADEMKKYEETGKVWYR